MRANLIVGCLSAMLIGPAFSGLQEARATLIGPNGSFGFVPFGRTTAMTAGAWKIGPNTTSVTVARSEVVNTSTNGDNYMTGPDTLEVSQGSGVVLSSYTFNMPTLNTTSALSTPLTLTVTNDNNDILMFTFSSLQATSSGNGALNLYWLGSFTSDSDHAYSTDSYAKLSAAFTESALNAIVNVSFSLEDPPASSLLTWNGSSTSLSDESIPEPATSVTLGSSLIAIWGLRRRKHC
jgi:hypothetical protein